MNARRCIGLPPSLMRQRAAQPVLAALWRQIVPPIAHRVIEDCLKCSESGRRGSTQGGSSFVIGLDFRANLNVFRKDLTTIQIYDTNITKSAAPVDIRIAGRVASAPSENSSVSIDM